MNMEMFIVYLTQYTDADDFATIRKGMVNTEFFQWYRHEVLNRCDPASLRSTTRKFFKFLAEEKGIYNSSSKPFHDRVSGAWIDLDCACCPTTCHPGPPLVGLPCPTATYSLLDAMGADDSDPGAVKGLDEGWMEPVEPPVDTRKSRHDDDVPVAFNATQDDPCALRCFHPHGEL
jgi:hypothetical protein